MVARRVIFFVDTGGAEVIVDTDFARELGIKQFGSVEEIRTSDTRRPCSAVAHEIGTVFPMRCPSDVRALDRHAQRVRAVGENHSPRILGGQGCRAFPDGLGWLDGPFGRSLGRGCALCAGKLG